MKVLRFLRVETFIRLHLQKFVVTRSFLYYVGFHEIKFMQSFYFCNNFPFFFWNVKNNFSAYVRNWQSIQLENVHNYVLIKNCFNSFSVNEAGFLTAEKMFCNKILWIHIILLLQNPLFSSVLQIKLSQN